MSDIPGYRTSELRSFNHLSPATITCETAQASIRSGFERALFVSRLNQAKESHPRRGGWYSQHAAKSPVNPGLHWTWVECGHLAKSANPDVNGHTRTMKESR